jgi:hypothetical protein
MVNKNTALFSGWTIHVNIHALLQNGVLTVLAPLQDSDQCQ